MTTMQKGSVVDLFCGAGGLSHGFVLEGFQVKAGIDVDPACRFPFEKNNKAQFLQWDVEGLTGEMLKQLFTPNEPSILVGCAPCQPFSTYAQKKENKKWKLLEQFSRLVKDCLPDIVSMENVPRLVKFGEGKLFEGFLNTLENIGYSTSWQVVRCADYGVPQTRKRLVLLASRVGQIELISPTHSSDNYNTVADTIQHLPPISAGEIHVSDPLHRASALSEKNLLRIQSSVPGGTWKDWGESIVADCHKKEIGRGYVSVYGRMRWDEPAPTMTTQCYGFGNGRFGHPDQDRAISLREAAMFQTFPQDYEFVESDKSCHFTTVGRLIGNAVPVNLGRAIARSIKCTLRG